MSRPEFYLKKPIKTGIKAIIESEIANTFNSKE